MRIPLKTAITDALQGFYDFSYNLFAAGKRTLAVSFIHKRKSFFQSGLNVIFKTPFEFREQLFAKHKVECVFLSTAAGVIPSATCDIGKNNIACERIVNNGEYYLRAIAPSNEIGITESTTEKNFTVTFKLASNTYAELYKYLQKGGSFMIEARVSKIYK